MSFLSSLGEYLSGDQPAFSEEELNLMRQGINPATQPEEKPSFFEPGGFGYEYLGPRLGENLGQFAGEQLYGTGRTAKGEPTGFPINRPSLLGDIATLPGTFLNVAGMFTDPALSLSDYIAGRDEVQVPKINQLASLTDSIQSGEMGSPQYNFYNRMQSGQPLSQQEIAQAQAFAQTMGTEFNPKTGYAKPTRAAIQDVSAPRGLTTVGGASLSEFLSGAAMPEYGFTSPERQMAGRGTTPTQSQFDRLSAEREARMEADIFNARGAYVRDPNTGKKVAAGSKDHSIIIEAEKAAERAGMIGSSKKNAFMALYKEQRQEEEELTKDLNDLKLQYETYRTQGQALNMEKTRAQIEKYQKSEAEKYAEVYSVAEKFVNDGLLNEEQAVLFIIDKMGGDTDNMYIDAESVSALGGGQASSTPTGMTFTPQQEAGIQAFMNANSLTQEEAIQVLKDAGKLD